MNNWRDCKLFLQRHVAWNPARPYQPVYGNLWTKPQLINLSYRYIQGSLTVSASTTAVTRNAFFLYYHRCYCCHCHSSYYLSSNPANGADTTDSLSAASVTTDVTEGGTVTYLSVSIAATA